MKISKHCIDFCPGDPFIFSIPYKDIVEQARLYIHTIGGFERFAEWVLIRPLDQE